MIRSISISGYRSLQNLDLRLSNCNVVCGPNGSGKSNFYQALRLLRQTADGRLISRLAEEGGLESALWAGPENISKEMVEGVTPVQGTVRTKPIRLLLGFAADDFSYGIDLGLPKPGSLFGKDPEIKNEWIWQGSCPDARSLIVHRSAFLLRSRQLGKRWTTIELPLHSIGSIFKEYSDPRNAPELFLIREMIQGWRFYDSMDSSSNSPARKPAVGTFSPILSTDGANLASAIRTIQSIGDREGFGRTIDAAFPGMTVHTEESLGGLMTLVRQPGMLRDFTSAELSDGTLRFLLLAAALFTPRPPAFMVLNEPETSLHPDLIPSLATLVADYSRENQILVITHNQYLRRLIGDQVDSEYFEFEKSLGRTQLVNQYDEGDDGGVPVGGGLFGRWSWPKR